MRDDGHLGFVREGFSSWNKPERLSFHVGQPNSFHNIAVKKCDDLMNQGQSIIHAYCIRLNASIDVSRYLLRQGLAFRGHNEKEESANKGNFLELLKYTADHNEVIDKVVLKNALGNNQMVSSEIQKDIVNSFAEEIVKSIIEEIDHGVFSLLVDESADVSGKEQMAVVFQFIDKNGVVKERFVGLVHVKETSSLSLKYAIDELFAKYGLSLNHVREQGYDGASNMKVKVLKHIENEGIENVKRRQAHGLLKYIHTFDCVFYTHLMLLILGLTENLSMALQKKDQEILNVMSLVESTKRKLQKLRDDGWDSLMIEISSFCKKHDADMLIMEEDFIDSRPRRKTNITNMHYYKVHCFNTVLDLQLQEFNDRFTEVNTELLVCMASLSPTEAFRGFDKSKLVKLAKFYPYFSFMECLSLEQQLGIYIDNVRHDQRFKSLKSLGDLARLMVETQKHHAHPLVYRLLKLVLTLPVAIASVERCFSAMKLVKTSLRNRMGDEFVSDYLVCFIEKKLLDDVMNEAAMNRFQAMSERRIHL